MNNVRREIVWLQISLLTVTVGCASTGARTLASEADVLNSVTASAQAIVVLGNHPPVDGRGRLSAELSARVELGVELYHAGRAPLLVMSGGDTGFGPEAIHMRAAAIGLGVPPTSIVIESKSLDTIDNARLTRELLCSSAPCVESVIVVSNAYHVRRAVPLFECAGFRAIGVSTPVSDRSARNRRYERRVAFYYGFIDECERARPDPG